MGTRLTIRVPADYDLARDVCSYGYFLLAPNRWDPAARTFSRVLRLEDGRTSVVVHQEDDRAGRPLTARFDRSLTRREQGEARRQIDRMLRPDDDVRAFHAVDPRWKRCGRGRLFRSPTMFEDVIKTVTSCNVAWPSTITMNRRLCEVVDAAFPSPRQLARRKATTLRARCRVGYRDARIVELGKLFTSGRDIDVAWFEDPATSDDDVERALLDLPGIGPYAAANIMQLLGRYSRLAIDTESVRHARVTLGWEGEDAALRQRLEQHYEPFGEHRFRSYWFELWTDYEARKGPAWTWDRETTGTTFTASRLKGAAPQAARAARRRRTGS
ncbi:MAG: hypothetical protein Tsb0013_20030 [Phycisphaerales bacterium]